MHCLGSDMDLSIVICWLRQEIIARGLRFDFTALIESRSAEGKRSDLGEVSESKAV